MRSTLFSYCMSIDSRDVYIRLNRNIDRPVADDLIGAFTELNSDETVRRINMLISSPGGNPQCAVDVYNSIKSLSVDVDTHNMGSVDSAAVIIYLSGTCRHALLNSKFHIHGVSRVYANGISLNEQALLDELSIVRKDNHSTAEIISGETSLAEEQVRSMLRKETILNANEALANGIVHEIKNIFIPREAEVINYFNKDSH